MVKKILVTGGAGFIGSNFINSLPDEDTQITVVDDLSLGRLDYLNVNTIDFHQANLQQRDLLVELFQGIDIVYHLAASGNVIQSIKDPESNFNNNVAGTLSVLEAARIAKVKHIIFSSTGGALMGNAAPPINEKTLPQPLSPYGASKLACEGYLKAYSNSFSLDYTIFRFGNVIGKNSLHKRGVINTFVKQIINGENLNIYGNVSRDFINVEDLCRTLRNAAFNPKARNQTFQIAAGKEIEIKKVAELCLNKLNAGKTSKICELPARLGEVSRTYSDISKVQKYLNHEISCPTSEVIEDVASWLYRQYSA